jgi:hypothetical protein
MGNTMPISTKLVLAGSALALALGSAALAGRAPKSKSQPADAAVTWSPVAIEPFALAKLLSEGAPDLLVIGLDEPRHPLRGAMPLALWTGAAASPSPDDALLAAPPKARRVVLAAFDQVRADRLARRLLAKGVETRVLLGGLDAWDRVMDADPATPWPNANAATWQTFRTQVALRHSFGDASLAPAAPVIAPVAPVVAPGGGAAPKKREGC